MAGGGEGLVWSAGLLGLDGTLSRNGVIEGDKAEALAEVGGLVDEDLGADDVAEWGKHLH